jgi:hypothetical protein
LRGKTAIKRFLTDLPSCEVEAAANAAHIALLGLVAWSSCL